MKHRMKRKVFGFTLIELMIVVVIIGILAAIGYPSYKQYVYKSRRSDAKAILLQMQLAEEKWRANNTSYTNTLSNLLPASNLISGVYYSNDRYYTLSVPLASANKYVLKAVPTTGKAQASDSTCQQFTINESGEHAGDDGLLADPVGGAEDADNDSGVNKNNLAGNCW